jgi:hypothetical protein
MANPIRLSQIINDKKYKKVIFRSAGTNSLPYYGTDIN